MEALQGAGFLPESVTYQDLIHDPDTLYGFIQSFKAHPEILETIAVDDEGRGVSQPEDVLSCGITLAQVQQLLIKTCARYFLEQATKDVEESTVTETRTTTRFIFFKKTEQFERKVGGGFDERKVRELCKYMAFDWQLPLLQHYAAMSTVQVLELEDAILALHTPEAIHTVCQFDQGTFKKAKQLAGDEFKDAVTAYPGSVGGIAQWSPDMYNFYRKTLGDKAWRFFSRDKAFFMSCAALDKPLASVYGDVLCYISAESLEEMQRLNIDKADVLLEAMKKAFGNKAEAVLAHPNFAKDVLRKLVESMLHISQEKKQLAISAQLTCKSIAAQVMDWLTKQPPIKIN
ncbi:MAG TPA: hypothetical protein VM661_18965 [Candidatus Sulfotelmatobacter sp.]|nr:hypothetical protein [Candidatus Sulfotelmatobacter sp.]